MTSGLLDMRASSSSQVHGGVCNVKMLRLRVTREWIVEEHEPSRPGDVTQLLSKFVMEDNHALASMGCLHHESASG
jgi:hypothetical protein